MCTPAQHDLLRNAARNRDPRPRVLIGEDNPVSAELLRDHVELWGFHAIVATSGAEILEAIGDDPDIHLLLLDWELPDMDGPTVCARLRAWGPRRYVYTVLVTQRDDEADLVRAMRAGADDYMTKPWAAPVLEARLRAGRRLVELYTSLQDARSTAELQALRDPLTALPNRRAILEALDHEIRRAERAHEHCSLVLLDIDHFKRINDAYGHPIGDRVLLEVAGRLHAVARKIDPVGRHGGEEFMAVPRGATAEQAVAIADRLREAVSAGPILTEAGPIRVTLSAGVACHNPYGPATSSVDLIHEADGALYLAKRDGRDRTVLASTDALAQAACQ